ncbi:MAG TPA: GAF domain-containing protein [Terriglobales bacterium]|jgi:hypothetical protein|nr:GAF domain-containing protein [Terriglobales bacterium]
MNRHPILSWSSSPLAADSASGNPPGEPVAQPPGGREPLRFPGDDGGKSLSEMAQRDLWAALRLLAERAQYITGASGAAIALREGAHMICRATAGPSAPELGARLQVNSGLSGESVLTQKILRCDDAATDARVNRESCRALGIASVVVMPLISEREVNGVFELFSGRTYAFDERDLTALQRIAEMIQTAVEHAEAVKQGEKQIAGEQEEDILLVDDAGNKPQTGPEAEPSGREQSAALPNATPQPGPQSPASERIVRPEADSTPVVLQGEPGSIHKCAACGFPVSQERTLCLDCEAAQSPAEKVVLSRAGEAPGFLSEYSSAENQRGWFMSGKYWIGALLLVGSVVAALHWLR